MDPDCGNGQFDSGEECDDGNGNNTHQCKNNCQFPKIIHIAAGGSHTCALTEHEKVICWGDNFKGQLGYGHYEDIGDDEKPSQQGYIN